MTLYELMRAYRDSVDAPWFTKAWDLNLLIARSGRVGQFDDLILLACVDDAGRQHARKFMATGDAWEGEWTDPTHSDGCIYVLDQHVPGGLDLGEHKTRPALRQVKPFRYVRWPGGHVPTVVELEERAAAHAFTDNRGTHLHNRASGRAPDVPQTDDSEGCTVTLLYPDHVSLIEFVKQQGTYRGSTIVSPTYCKRSALRAIRAT